MKGTQITYPLSSPHLTLGRGLVTLLTLDRDKPKQACRRSPAQRTTKGKKPSRTIDMYIPGYSGGWLEALEAELDNMGDNGWGEVVPFNSTDGPSWWMSQQSTSIKFMNNAQRAGPSNANLNSGSSHNPSHTSSIEPLAGNTNA